MWQRLDGKIQESRHSKAVFQCIFELPSLQLIRGALEANALSSSDKRSKV